MEITNHHKNVLADFESFRLRILSGEFGKMNFYVHLKYARGYDIIMTDESVNLIPHPVVKAQPSVCNEAKE